MVDLFSRASRRSWMTPSEFLLTRASLRFSSMADIWREWKPKHFATSGLKLNNHSSGFEDQFWKVDGVAVTRTLLDSFTILGLIYESQFWKLDSRCVIFATVLWFDSFAVLIRFAFLMMRVNGWLLIDNRRNSGCSVLKCWVGISKQFPRIPWSGKEALQSSYYWINESKIIYYLKIVPWGTGHEYRLMIYFGNNFSSLSWATKGTMRF